MFDQFILSRQEQPIFISGCGVSLVLYCEMGVQ